MPTALACFVSPARRICTSFPTVRHVSANARTHASFRVRNSCRMRESSSKSAAATAFTSTGLPCSMRREVAIERSSGKRFWLQLTPMPMTTYSASCVSKDTESSVKMPQSFFPFRTGSFGHLIPACIPVTCLTAVHTHSPASAVRCKSASAGSCGRIRKLKYSPPGSERKLLPRRPRPAVCLRDRTAVPSDAPFAASVLR